MGRSMGVIDERYWTVEELANLLGVKKRSVYKWIARKDIGVTRFGRREVRFSESQVQAFLRTYNVAEKPKDIWAESKKEET